MLCLESAIYTKNIQESLFVLPFRSIHPPAAWLLSYQFLETFISVTELEGGISSEHLMQLVILICFCL